MNKHIMQSLCLGWIMFLPGLAFSQIPISVPDGSFEPPFVNNLNGACPTFANCITSPTCTAPPTPNEWRASHGSPGLSTATSGFSAGPAHDGIQYLTMWDQAIEGEGAFVDFPFREGQSYLICLWYRLHSYMQADDETSPAYNNSDAKFFIKLATDLFEMPSVLDCGSQIQNPFDPTLTISTIEYQNVPNRSDVNTIEWKQLKLNVTPDKDYSQLWIHPDYQGSNHDIQIFVDIDDIDIYTACSDPLTFDEPGTTIPGGPIQAQDLIQVGTDFGAGSGNFVLNDPLVHTEMVAGDLIHFRPNTHLSATNGSFTARIEYCSTASLCLSGPNRNGASLSVSNALPKAYPNPLGPNQPIMLEYQSMYEGEVQLSIIDLSGRIRQVHSFYKEAHLAVKQKIPLPNLAPGMYILKINEGQAFNTLKVSIVN